MIRYVSASVLVFLAACGQTPKQPAAGDPAQPAEVEAQDSVASEDARPFSRIAPDETVRFTGTEPFWGGQVAFTALTYSTPDNPDGTTIAVERFAGRGGVSWTGQFEGAPFTLAATPGECSDGMSDRTYPYVVTLEVNGEQRRGCAWTESDPFTDRREGS